MPRARPFPLQVVARAAALALGLAVLADAKTPASAKTPVGESASTPNLARAAPLPRHYSRDGPAANSSLGPNLIANPSVEVAGAGEGLADDWLQGGFGSNTRTFAYPVAGVAGGRALRVSVSEYADGDAKWYFADVPVRSGASYQFSDASLADVATTLVARFRHDDGSYTYQDLLEVPPSTTFRANLARFAAPPGAVAVTVFHLLRQAGSLTTDDFSLNALVAPGTGNLVDNGDFETATADGTAPARWRTRRVGRNGASFDYPVGGASGNAAGVRITQYDSGSAGWYFEPLALAPGSYRYTVAHRADRASAVFARYRDSSGVVYRRLGALRASTGWTESSFTLPVPASARNVSILHTLAGVGTLALDNARVEAQASGRGAVTFRFDDGTAGHYSVAAPKLDQYGFAGTFYVITRQLADTGYAGYVSRSQVQDLAARGHEIGAHTRTHAHLSQLSPEQARDEIAGARADLRAWGVGPALSFAYPFGEYALETIDVVRQAGFSSAAATVTGYVTPASDPYQLEYQEITTAVSIDDVKRWIDTAAGDGTWLILTFHGIDDSGEYYSCPPALFRAIVDYVAARHVDVVTAAQGFAALGR
jgi:peptidoglycan/xylan/chitin deacetylase (PgdA/CDA1 family)